MEALVGRLREYARTERALQRLELEERRILELCYIVPKIGNLSKLCQEMNVEKSSVYRRRDKALRNFQRCLDTFEAGMQREDLVDEEW